MKVEAHKTHDGLASPNVPWAELANFAFLRLSGSQTRDPSELVCSCEHHVGQPHGLMNAAVAGSSISLMRPSNNNKLADSDLLPSSSPSFVSVSASRIDGYNVKDIIYRWARKDTAVERDKEISLPQFDIVKTVQKYRLEELSSGKRRQQQHHQRRLYSRGRFISRRRQQPRLFSIGSIYGMLSINPTTN